MHSSEDSARQEAARLFKLFDGKFDVSVIATIDVLHGSDNEVPRVSASKKRREQRKRSKRNNEAAAEANKKQVAPDRAPQKPVEPTASGPKIVIKKRRTVATGGQNEAD